MFPMLYFAFARCFVLNTKQKAVVVANMYVYFIDQHKKHIMQIKHAVNQRAVLCAVAVVFSCQISIALSSSCLSIFMGKGSLGMHSYGRSSRYECSQECSQRNEWD